MLFWHTCFTKLNKTCLHILLLLLATFTFVGTYFEIFEFMLCLSIIDTSPLLNIFLYYLLILNHSWYSITFGCTSRNLYPFFIESSFIIWMQWYKIIPFLYMIQHALFASNISVLCVSGVKMNVVELRLLILRLIAMKHLSCFTKLYVNWHRKCMCISSAVKHSY